MALKKAIQLILSKLAKNKTIRSFHISHFQLLTWMLSLQVLAQVWYKSDDCVCPHHSCRLARFVDVDLKHNFFRGLNRINSGGCFPSWASLAPKDRFTECVHRPIVPSHPCWANSVCPSKFFPVYEPVQLSFLNIVIVLSSTISSDSPFHIFIILSR